MPKLPITRAIWHATAVLAFLIATLTAQADEEALYERKRAEMIETIRNYASADPALEEEKGIADSVVGAMAQTKRHLFVPEKYRPLAYSDRPLPIGNDQTISQPYIVALMTHFARVPAGGTVLEIGTGSGYQAAVLARIAKKVCTIEIVRPLGKRARALLDELGYTNVEVRIGDGYEGWPECGPFDAVVVTAALGHVPPKLIEQMKVGGRLVMPVGTPGAPQRLTIVEKTAAGKTQTREVGRVRFVPFTRAPE